MPKRTKNHNKDEIIFLGTGGARFVIARQLRATGGIFFRIGGKNILVDPGPESYYRFLTYLPDFNPEKIDAIILTHKHIDHSADVNVYLDVLTQGGFKKNGFLIAPSDAFGEEGVVYKYLLEFLNEIRIIKPNLKIEFNGVEILFPIRHQHRVETYGLMIKTRDYSISYITDTKFFPELIDAYRSEIVILSLLKLEPSEVDHLSVPDCEIIISSIKPRVAIITHFGMTVIRAGPWNIARRLKEQTGITVLAAEDGRHFEIDKLLAYREPDK
jgi:phosphoribosyl 1,2-cyclic phosphodiesterase